MRLKIGALFLIARILLSAARIILNRALAQQARKTSSPSTGSWSPIAADSVLFTTGKSPASSAVILHESSGRPTPVAIGVGSVLVRADHSVWIWSGSTWDRSRASKECMTGGIFERSNSGRD